MRLSRTDLKIVAMGVGIALTSGATGAAAAGAYDARNADKVDGKHAVASSSSVAGAAGRLVALDGTGHLAAKFLPKVNADRIDGIDSTDLLQKCSRGAIQGTASVDGTQVPATAGPDNNADYTATGVSSGWVCTGGSVLVRRWYGNTVGRIEVLFDANYFGDQLGWAGPGNNALPQVTSGQSGILATASGPVQCSYVPPPYVICFNVETTDLSGTPTDGPFTISIG